MSSNARKSKARRQQKLTGTSYMRALREVDGGAAPGGRIPDSADTAAMLALLGLDTAGTPDLTRNWSTKPDVLRPIPIGLRAGGTPLWLDLNRQDAGGNGPNGLLVGTTGSGKSTALNAMLFALCAQHSPDQLQLVGIGGSKPGVVSNAFTQYPHVVDVPAWERDDPELTFLQELMNKRTGRPGEPKLVVVIDEFPFIDYEGDARNGHRMQTPNAGIVSERIDTLMRHGRALGIHVLISAQRLPTLGAPLTDRSDYCITQRTNTSEESRYLVGSTAAYELPPSAGLGLFCSPVGGAQDTDLVAFRGFQISRDLVKRVGLQLAASTDGTRR